MKPAGLPSLSIRRDIAVSEHNPLVTPVTPSSAQFIVLPPPPIATATTIRKTHPFECATLLSPSSPVCSSRLRLPPTLRVPSGPVGSSTPSGLGQRPDVPPSARLEEAKSPSTHRGSTFAPTPTVPTGSLLADQTTPTLGSAATETQDPTILSSPRHTATLSPSADSCVDETMSSALPSYDKGSNIPARVTGRRYSALPTTLRRPSPTANRSGPGPSRSRVHDALRETLEEHQGSLSTRESQALSYLNRPRRQSLAPTLTTKTLRNSMVGNNPGEPLSASILTSSSSGLPRIQGSKGQSLPTPSATKQASSPSTVPRETLHRTLGRASSDIKSILKTGGIRKDGSIVSAHDDRRSNLQGSQIPIPNTRPRVNQSGTMASSLGGNGNGNNPLPTRLGTRRSATVRPRSGEYSQLLKSLATNSDSESPAVPPTSTIRTARAALNLSSSDSRRSSLRVGGGDISESTKASASTTSPYRITYENTTGSAVTAAKSPGKTGDPTINCLLATKEASRTPKGTGGQRHATTNPLVVNKAWLAHRASPRTSTTPSKNRVHDASLETTVSDSDPEDCHDAHSVAVDISSNQSSAASTPSSGPTSGSQRSSRYNSRHKGATSQDQEMEWSPGGEQHRSYYANKVSGQPQTPVGNKSQKSKNVTYKVDTGTNALPISGKAALVASPSPGESPRVQTARRKTTLPTSERPVLTTKPVTSSPLAQPQTRNSLADVEITVHDDLTPKTTAASDVTAKVPTASTLGSAPTSQSHTAIDIDGPPPEKPIPHPTLASRLPSKGDPRPRALSKPPPTTGATTNSKVQHALSTAKGSAATTNRGSRHYGLPAGPGSSANGGASLRRASESTRSQTMGRRPSRGLAQSLAKALAVNSPDTPPSTSDSPGLTTATTSSSTANTPSGEDTEPKRNDGGKTITSQVKLAMITGSDGAKGIDNPEGAVRTLGAKFGHLTLDGRSKSKRPPIPSRRLPHEEAHSNAKRVPATEEKKSVTSNTMSNTKTGTLHHHRGGNQRPAVTTTSSTLTDNVGTKPTRPLVVPPTNHPGKTTIGSKVQQHHPSAGSNFQLQSPGIGRGTTGLSSSSESSSTRDRTTAAVPPLTSQVVLKMHGRQLTNLERQEISEYPSIYYFGQNARKRQSPKGQALYNQGYDDDRGDYIVLPHDHLLYRYEILETLGKGSFGQVLRVHDHKLGKQVAVKIIRNKKRFHCQAQIEIKLLEMLRRWDGDGTHHVIHILEQFVFRSHLCIVTELLSMNLYEYIKANGFQGCSLVLIRQFAVQLLRALLLLYRHKVIHCDLKPENILLIRPNQTGIKVIDFGSSCFENERIYTYIQSRFYRSPEVIMGLSYGMGIDIWSFGCILAELHTGYPLFPGENEHDQLSCIMEVLGVPPGYLVDQASRRSEFFDSTGQPRPFVNSKGKKRRPGAKHLASVLKTNDKIFLDFLYRCLEWDPKHRMTPEQAVQHEWITGHVEPGRRYKGLPAIPSKAPGGPTGEGSSYQSGLARRPPPLEIPTCQGGKPGFTVDAGPVTANVAGGHPATASGPGFVSNGPVSAGFIYPNNGGIVNAGAMGRAPVVMAGGPQFPPHAHRMSVGGSNPVSLFTMEGTADGKGSNNNPHQYPSAHLAAHGDGFAPTGQQPPGNGYTANLGGYPLPTAHPSGPLGGNGTNRGTGGAPPTRGNPGIPPSVTMTGINMGPPTHHAMMGGGVYGHPQSHPTMPGLGINANPTQPPLYSFGASGLYPHPPPPSHDHYQTGSGGGYGKGSDSGKDGKTSDRRGSLTNKP
ncbi:serine/threonine protein kinase, CMGC, dual-specificity [Dispira parvispora]|uniref:dual-specificity kinase n=1 Tax=Dispira parvispora TaxID=1520584 RepID=A0A9W8E2D1_9FUNG|nr:serine/threonine protein kinase, CMGC, dual-specificity [Dispira parvispora]